MRLASVIGLLALASSCNAAPRAPVSAKPPASVANAQTGSSAKLIAPGAEPRAPLFYAFSNKARTVHARIAVSTSGMARAEQPTLSMHVTFTATPTPKRADVSAVGIKVIDFDVVTTAPEVATDKATLEKVIGLSGGFDATTHGDVANLNLGTASLPQGIRDIAGMLGQVLALLVIPLPNEPVGVGAKWTTVERTTLPVEGATISTTLTLTLQARDKDTATITVDATQAGTVPATDPLAPGGTSLERKTTTTFTVVICHDGVARRVDGEAINVITQKVPGQDDQSMTLKVAQHIESE
jgi:hypothetical protein